MRTISVVLHWMSFRKGDIRTGLQLRAVARTLCGIIRLLKCATPDVLSLRRDRGEAVGKGGERGQGKQLLPCLLALPAAALLRKLRVENQSMGLHNSTWLRRGTGRLF
jgi:hypothetical protein